MTDEARAFFTTLYPEGLPAFGDASAFCLLWTEPGNVSHWHPQLDDSFYATIERLKVKANVYFGCGISPKDYGPGARCKRDDIVGIPGVWLDLDFQKGHKKRGLMEGPDDAEALLALLGLPPTIIVHTGNGWQAWWCFKEVWTFADDAERQQAATLAQQWNATAISKAKERGWVLDNVSDLARVMRPAGTLNRKGENPVPATVVRITDRRYDPQDFEPYFAMGADLAAPTLDAALDAGWEYVLSAQAAPNVELFAALLNNHPDFKRTWDHKRGFPSESEYDMALASMAFLANWPVQEIVNLLIAHRRKYQADLKLDRHGDNCYYRMTLKKARPDHATQPDLVLSHFNQKGEVPPDVEDDHAALKQLIGQKLGLEVTRVLKYLMTPPRYKIELNGVMVDLGGIENVLTYRLFERIVADELRIRLANVKPAEWRKLTEYFLKVAVEEDVGPEGSATDAIQVLLEQWIQTRLRTQDSDWQKCLVLHEPFVRDDVIYFPLSGLSHFIFAETSERLGLKTLAFYLKGYGYQSERLRIHVPEDGNRRAFRRVWRYSELGSLGIKEGVGQNATNWGETLQGGA